mmetsp:Transcript_41088/g.82361  ORF Transcript_41088/g.82361 Transcript_41088/m.82361 type:complete len:133 (+) Transcript_41088:684-1082(+)
MEPVSETETRTCAVRMTWNLKCADPLTKTLSQVMQYRCLYGIEQWLVKWKDDRLRSYGEDHNTWEPWDHLLTAEVRTEAQRVRTAALPRDQAGLTKLVVVTLKAALDERGLETTGQKAELVGRLLEALQKEI